MNTEVIYSLISAIFGAIIGSLVTSFFASKEQRRQNQVETTLNLFERFQSSDMLLSRINAEEIFSKNLQLEQPLSYAQLKEKLDVSDWQHISKVLHFYEQFSSLHQTKYLDNVLAASLIGTHFVSWYNRHLRIMERISQSRDAREFRWSQHIAHLVEWLKPNEHFTNTTK